MSSIEIILCSLAIIILSSTCLFINKTIEVLLSRIRALESEEKINEDALVKRVTSAAEERFNTLAENLEHLVSVECIVCGKQLMVHKYSIYTDSKGRKFCSHACIDKFVKEAK